jgi:hypothetical protein
VIDLTARLGRFELIAFASSSWRGFSVTRFDTEIASVLDVQAGFVNFALLRHREVEL